MNQTEVRRSIPNTARAVPAPLSGRLPEATSDARANACRVMMEGAYEILGANGRSQVMHAARADDQQALAAARSLLNGLSNTYGPAGARGLSLRIGRAMFRYILKEMGDRAGFREMGFRILPSPRRVESGLGMLACLFSEVIGAPAQVSELENAWALRLPCGLPDGEEGQMVRWLVTGLLQEFSSWAGGGRFYHVTAADGPAVMFKVEKKPLD